MLLYGSGTSAGKWYYKEKVEGQRRYKEKQLFGASSLEQAIEMAAEAAIELAKTPEKKPSYRYASDPLTLIQREEKLIKQKEKLAKEEQKKATERVNSRSSIRAYLVLGAGVADAVVLHAELPVLLLRRHDRLAHIPQRNGRPRQVREVRVRHPNALASKVRQHSREAEVSEGAVGDLK